MFHPCVQTVKRQSDGLTRSVMKESCCCCERHSDPPASSVSMLNGDRAQMDVTAAARPHCAPAAVVTWIYNHCRPYIRRLKWTKVPGQQKMANKPGASLAEPSQHALR